MTRFEYFKHLRSIGVKEKHAVKMAEQVDDDGRDSIDDKASDAVGRFTRWTETEEGHSFWSGIKQKYIAKGN